MEIQNEYKKNLYFGVLTLNIVLVLLFGMKFLSEIRSYGALGGENIITVSGHGEVQAVPDIANIYITITKDAPTVKEAQELVASVESKVLEFLRESGIEDKDIKAENASFYPKYEYKYNAKSFFPCNEYGCPPNEGRNVIVGYTATESINIKVRKIDEAGELMQGIGALGVTQLNGPNFSIDDEDKVKAEARKEAIEDAREKAKVLAQDLGVRLGRVQSFSEGGGYAPVIYYAKTAESDRALGAPAEIPKGENTVSSDVTVTYRIH